MALRILMITSYGLEGRYFRDIARGFSKTENKLAVLSLSGAPSPDWVNEFSVIDFTKKRFRKPGLRSNFFDTFRAVKEFSPDVIQTHLFLGGVVGIFISKITGIPVILTRHHIDEHKQVGSRIHFWLDKFSARAATQVVVCSVAAKNWLVKEEGIPDQKVTVINQGFYFENLTPSLSEIEKAKVDLGFSEGKFNIICISRYSKTKGQEYLIHAIDQLKSEGFTVTLTFVGPGDKTWLQNMVSKCGLIDTVQLLGQRIDVAACIAAADLVVHPSLVDSFSQLVIEAQAVGGPLIATDIAAAREQIINGETGIIIPPRNSQAIVDAIKVFYADSELSEKFCVAARIHVRRAFPLERMVSEELECVLRITQETRR